ncbi:MAG: GntR family transcriptional regulator [Polyangiales bacterium]|nr:FadR family transcriptional regulator [Myxococcales bacterium]MCB9656697.1 FadR family transcriptional regulator [Sandaracinaceae bacterium]
MKNDVASRIEQVLVRELLQGAYPMGTRMPTVRELAERFDVNVTTVQRALARLEATGLVTARQGSGIHVEDPALTGEITLAPALLEAALHDSAARRRILQDFLDVRRALMTTMMIEHRDAIIAAGATLVGAAIELESVADDDIDGKLSADAAFSRLMVKLAGDNMTVAWLYNTALRMLRQVPFLAEAYYADSAALRRHNLAIIQALVATRESRGELWEELNRILVEMDHGIVERFETLLQTIRDSEDGDTG